MKLCQAKIKPEVAFLFQECCWFLKFLLSCLHRHNSVTWDRKVTRFITLPSVLGIIVDFVLKKEEKKKKKERVRCLLLGALTMVLASHLSEGFLTEM